MVDATLWEHRLIWEKKPVLRAIYSDYYRRIVAECRHGLTLEIGGGTGNLKAFIPNVISTDIVPEPWLDAAADAQFLPFRDGSLNNIVAVDVLHHIEYPIRFLREAERVLQPGGRLILVEPAITPVSWVFFRLFHPEPVIMGEDPLREGQRDPNRKPFDANQAIPTLLFGRYRERMAALVPSLSLAQFERMSLFAYPLSGGFRPWRLIPQSIVELMLGFERRLAPMLGSLMAFRLFAVLEKHDDSMDSSSGRTHRERVTE